MPEIYGIDGTTTGVTKNGTVVIKTGFTSTENFEVLNSRVKSQDIADITDKWIDRFDDVGYYV